MILEFSTTTQNERNHDEGFLRSKQLRQWRIEIDVCSKDWRMSAVEVMVDHISTKIFLILWAYNCKRKIYQHFGLVLIWWDTFIQNTIQLFWLSACFINSLYFALIITKNNVAISTNRLRRCVHPTRWVTTQLRNQNIHKKKRNSLRLVSALPGLAVPQNSQVQLQPARCPYHPIGLPASIPLNTIVLAS